MTEVATALNLLSALLVVALATPDQPLAPLMAVLPVALAPWVRGRPDPRHLLVALGGLVAVGTWTGLVEPATATLAAVAVHQRLAPDPHHAPRLLALTGALLFVAAAARTADPLFVPCWAVWTATLPATLGAALPARALGALAAAWLGLAGLTFAVLPRSPRVGVDPRLLDLADLADRLELDDLAVGDDPLEIATVAFLDGSAADLRLRGAALDTFDGRTWTRAAPRRATPWTDVWATSRLVRITQAPLGGLLLTPGAVAEAPTGTWQDAGDSWWTAASGPVDRTWRVAPGVPIGTPALPPGDRTRALALPLLDRRVDALAQALVTPAMGPRERAWAIQRHLAHGHAYDPTTPARDVASFLLDDRRGDCVAFGTAAAVLARSVGVPSRLVVGFVHGEPIPGGRRFRASGAHAWAELHIDGEGWVEVDATPVGDRAPLTPPVTAGEAGPPAPAPDTPAAAASTGPDLRAVAAPILGYDAERQGRAATALLVAAAALAVGWLVRRRGWGRGWRRPRPRPGVAGELDRAFAAARRRGWAWPEHLPPVDAARSLVQAHGEAARPLEELAWLYYEVVHGGQEEAARLARARGDWRRGWGEAGGRGATDVRPRRADPRSRRRAGRAARRRV